MGPGDYMFLPYVNYTVPMELCVYGIDQSTVPGQTNPKLVSFGQRAMALFPYYAVFDRAANTVQLSIGGSEPYNEVGKP